jgi:FkbM family methyltransferase
MPDPLHTVDYSAYLAQPSEPELELLRLFPTAAPLVIFDVGSCEGEDTVRYARRFPQARLFAFEPLPNNQALVRGNLTRYAVANAELVPLALSDRAGEATFHVSSGQPPEAFAGADWNYGNKSSSLLPPVGEAPMYGWVEFKEAITVRTETLDAFCATRGIDRIDFIHMDVQGAERLVLAGASAMLPSIRALWLEVSDKPLYAGQMLRPEIEAFMHIHGFALGCEVRREIEGDQFYVNKRFARAWPYLAGRCAAGLYRQARRAASRVKRALLG